jgi:hypothetical protein
MASDDRLRVTTSLTDQRLEFFENVAEDVNADSDAEVMRAIVDRAIAHSDAEDRADNLQARAEELQRELRAANKRIDTANEIVEYVETERSLERRRSKAGALTRLKWWMTGMPEE